MEHLDADELAELRRRISTLKPQAAARLTRSMDAGTFGLCVACGEELPFAVLKDRPQQAMCGDCVQDLRAGRASQRLGVCGVNPRKR